MPLGFKGRKPFHRTNTDNVAGESSSSNDGYKHDDDGQLGKTGVSTSVGISEMDVDEGLVSFEQNHQWDPNLPTGYAEQVHEALKAHDVEAEIAIERGLAEQSPYPEVQAAVRNYDEDVPCNTVRAWVLGMILTTIGSGLNMLFSMRSPSIVITSIVAQLVA